MASRNTYDVIVIGGGASGLAAALAAARTGARTCVLERDVETGLSILATGNGRCNLSNAHLDPKRYLHPEIARTVMGTEPENEVNAFFESIGVMIAEEDEGRLYPYSRRAESVRDALLGACKRLGVEVRCCHELERAAFDDATETWTLRACAPKVQPCSKRKGDFRASIRAKRREATTMAKAPVRLQAARVVIACGGTSGQTAHVAELFDIPCLPLSPVLCPVAASLPGNPGALRALDGLRVHGELSLRRNGEVLWHEPGEILFRPYGISGIAAFNLSRRAQAGDTAFIDLFPQLCRDELHELLLKRTELLDAFSANNPAWFDGLLAPALARVVCSLYEANHPGDHDVIHIVNITKHLKLDVEGTTEHQTAQVVRGGIPFDDVNLRTLAVAPGLFACGEALDMDADCGGFNLAWAWLSGLRAGSAAAQAARTTA